VASVREGCRQATNRMLFTSLTDIAIKLAQQVSSDLFAISHSALDGRRLPLSKTLTHRCLISCRVLTIGRRLPLSKKRHSSPCRTPNTTSTLRPPITKDVVQEGRQLSTHGERQKYCERFPRQPLALACSTSGTEKSTPQTLPDS
jgi:hypothetical protein